MKYMYVLLNVSKAFDRVEHGKLFQLLFDRKLAALNIRLVDSAWLYQTVKECSVD